MSETAAVRDILAPYCEGRFVVDFGAGGDRIVPNAWAFDLPVPYTHVGDERQQLRGTITDLSMFADGALDVAYSSHLLEDFTYEELRSQIVPQLRRILRPNGLLVTNCPDQQRFLDHCRRTGQGLNLAHKEASFALETFEDRVLADTDPWETVLRVPEHGAYSWCLVVRKVGP